MFMTISKTVINTRTVFIHLFVNGFNLVEIKNLLFQKKLTIPQTINFNLFETDIVCRQQFDENSIKFAKCVENKVGKGEIACYEQFLLFPQCFQKTCTVDT